MAARGSSRWRAALLAGWGLFAALYVVITVAWQADALGYRYEVCSRCGAERYAPRAVDTLLGSFQPVACDDGAGDPGCEHLWGPPPPSQTLWDIHRAGPPSDLAFPFWIVAMMTALWPAPLARHAGRFSRPWWIFLGCAAAVVLGHSVTVFESVRWIGATAEWGGAIDLALVRATLVENLWHLDAAFVTMVLAAGWMARYARWERAARPDAAATAGEVVWLVVMSPFALLATFIAGVAPLAWGIAVFEAVLS